MNIAVCDDDYVIQFEIDGFLQEIFSAYQLKGEITCYSSGEELCKNFEKGKFNLIFLDIEYAGMNGVEVGHYIREENADEEVEIAYISGNRGYAMELFEYRPINFLLKPLNKRDIQKVIDKYLKLSCQNAEMFHYKVGGKRIRVSLSEVYYFSSRGRKITIHKMNEEEEFYGILEKVYSEVKNKHFLYVHKSYIVNYQYIKKMEYEQVTLKGGETIPISQARRTAIRKQFHELKKEEL